MNRVEEKLKNAPELDKYIIARWTYAIGEEYLNDQEYRVLEDYIKSEKLSDLPYKSWSTDECPTELLEKYGLNDLIRQDFVVQGVAESIPNCSSDKALEDILYSAKSKKECRMSYKLDGWNVCSHFINGKFQNAHTRGRSARPIDVDLMKHLTKDIPYMGHVIISGELIIPNDKWEKYKEKTGNTSQRNSVSSLIANNDYEYAEWVCYKIDGDEVPKENKYKLLQSIGYKTPDYIEFDGTGMTVNDVKEKLKQFDCKNYWLPTDGVVFECESFQIALRLLNYSEQVLIGKIKGYKEEFGAHGTSFQIEIEPLRVGGIVRRFIPIQNLGNIEDNNLRIGMPICFNIRSAVAPVFNPTAQALLVKQLQESGIMKDDFTVEESYFDSIYNTEHEYKEHEIGYDEEETDNSTEHEMMKLLNSQDVISFD